MRHPPLDIFGQHAAILGRTGSGKSFAARGIVEGLLDAGRKVCVLDITGVWWGLKSNDIGMGPGYPVVIVGGEHADVPMTEAAAPVVARLIAETRHSFVVDLSALGVNAQHRFATAFCEELYRVNRAPLHLVMEEVDEIAPQTGQPGAERMIGAVCRLYQRGRVKGLRLLAITQRPANLHKRVLAQCSTMVLMRLMAPRDRKAALDWIGGHADADRGKKIVAELPKMQTGTGYIWAPEIDLLERMAFPAIKTFDSMRAPADGETAMEPVNLADVDLAEISAALAVADEKPALAAKVGHSDPAAIEVARQEGYERGLAEGRDQGVRDMLHQVRFDAGWLVDHAKELAEIGERWRMPVDAPSPTAPLPKPVAAPPPSVPPTRRATAVQPRANGAATGLHTAARAMLTVLAQHGRPLTWTETTTLAGLAPSGGHFNTGRAQMRAQSLVAEDGERITLTDAGRQAIGPVETAPTDPAALLRLWSGKVGGAGPKMLEALWAMRGKAVTWPLIAQACQMQASGGHWNTGRAELRRNNLIDESPHGIRLVEMLR